MDKDLITEIRKRIGFSKAQFAERLGVSERAVGYWESGERRISKSHARFIEYLFEGTIRWIKREEKGGGWHIASK